MVKIAHWIFWHKKGGERKMQIEGITPNTTQGASKVENGLGKDAFYKLLITELQNQNPLEPMNAEEFIAQLTQFSQLEALEDINNQFQVLTAYQASINNLLAVGLMGKKVKAAGNAISLEKGNEVTLHYDLAADASKVIINIYDSEGRLVRTLEEGAQEKGEHEVNWDGKDNEGNELPSGDYTFKVMAEDKNGDPVKANTYFMGTVTGVEFDESGQLYLKVGDIFVSLNEIISIEEV